MGRGTGPVASCRGVGKAAESIKAFCIVAEPFYGWVILLLFTISACGRASECPAFPPKQNISVFLC